MGGKSAEKNVAYGFWLRAEVFRAFFRQNDIFFDHGNETVFPIDDRCTLFCRWKPLLIVHRNANAASLVSGLESKRSAERLREKRTLKQMFGKTERLEKRILENGSGDTVVSFFNCKNLGCVSISDEISYNLIELRLEYFGALGTIDTSYSF